jgi:carboxyl-terminal processing protease
MKRALHPESSYFCMRKPSTQIERIFWDVTLVLTLLYCALSGGGYCYCAPPPALQESTQQLALEDLPKVLRELVMCHPGKRVVDEDVLFRSHNKLFSLFDPDKTYLLLHEVAPFLDPQNGKRFLTEYQEGIFTTYYKILALCREAVRRSRIIRSGFFFTDSQTIDMVRKQPSLSYEFYARDKDELTARLFRKYVHLIAERLPVDEEADNAKVHSAVMLAEKELEAHEAAWVRLDTTPEGSKEANSSAARVILKSILSSLDTHSDVMGEHGAREIRERLTKEGFGTGVVVCITDTGCFVKKIIRGSPADRLGGIQLNDTIVTVDGRSCSQMSASEIEDLLNQETEGMVQFVLKRPSRDGRAEQTVNVRIPRSRYTMLEGRLETQTKTTPQGTIAILTLHSFYRGGPGVSSSEDLKRALLEILSQGPIVGVVLDLRDNGGGYITEAVRVVGEFIKTGVVMTAVYADGSRLVFRDTDPEVIFSGPMVVLTSKATASAAEIVAQALKDYGRAIIVGDPQTYGKGSIQMQTVTDMTEKEVYVNVPLRLTVGRFYTVSGYCPQSLGVKSDIVVPGLLERPKAEEEVSDTRLKQRIDPLFHDSLDDVRVEVQGWYQEHYLPFVQQNTNQYRRWIPMLQKKSQQRMKKNPLWSILDKKPISSDEGETLRKKVDSLQMEEAFAIEEDLIQMSIERKDGK